MKYVKLSRDKVCMVNDEDFEKISKLNWYCLKSGYAVTRPWNKETKTYSTLYMHRFIMGAKPKTIVDHIDRNTLNNQKENLRFCTHKDNVRNSKALRSNNTSGHKGVYQDKRNGRWRVRITVDYIGKNFGGYDTKTEAIMVYKEAAKKYFGAFCNS